MREDGRALRIAGKRHAAAGSFRRVEVDVGIGEECAQIGDDDIVGGIKGGQFYVDAVGLSARGGDGCFRGVGRAAGAA